MNDNIYKINISDKKINNKTINDFKIIIDDSMINKVIVKHIPINHIVLNKVIEKYDIDNIKLTIEKDNVDDTVLCAYFEFNNQNKMIIKKICSLLLSIK